MTVVDFTLSNARRFFSSMGNPSDMKALMNMIVTLVIWSSTNGIPIAVVY